MAAGGGINRGVSNPLSISLEIHEQFERHPFLEIHVKSVHIPSGGGLRIPAEIRAHIRSNIQSSGDEAALHLDKAAPSISLSAGQRRILPLIVASLADLGIVASSPALVSTDLLLLPLLLAATVVALLATVTDLTALLLVDQEIVENAGDLATQISKAADIALVALRAADVLQHDERKRVALQASLAAVNLDADRVVELGKIDPPEEILESQIIAPLLKLRSQNLLVGKLGTSGGIVKLESSEIVTIAASLEIAILLALMEVLNVESHLDLSLAISASDANWTILFTARAR